MEDIDLRQIERNVFRDYCEDGLIDMLFGTWFLLIGLLLPGGTVALFIIFPVVLAAPLIRGLKRRFTDPRTGYVRLRRGDPRVMPRFALGSLALGLAALVAVLVGSGVIAQPGRWYRWMPVFFGIWLAGVFLGLARRVGLLRYYVMAGVALAGGPTLALLPLEGKLKNLGLFLAAVGAVLLALGAFAFVRFLRRHPLPAGGTSNVTE